MAQRRDHLKEIKGILKDIASLIKVKCFSKNPTMNTAILHATTHTTISPPSEHHLNTVVSLGSQSIVMAHTCIGSITSRLHNTHSPYVALKCFIVLNNVINKGLKDLRDQLPLQILNLSEFRGRNNFEERELWSWVQWSSDFLELKIMVSRVLGYYFSSPVPRSYERNTERQKLPSSSSTGTDLLREMNALIAIVEEICRVPDSLYLQINNVVHEAMILVGEDYRATQHQIKPRLSDNNKFHDQISRLSLRDLSELLGCLERLEVSRPRLTQIFVNRKRFDELWELISRRKLELEKMIKERR